MVIEQKHHLYIRLIRPEGGLWRPVEGVKVSETDYRVVSDISDPENQTWEFNTGDVVRCQNHVFADGATGLIAVEKIR